MAIEYARLTNAEGRYVACVIAAMGGPRQIKCKACYRNSQRLIIFDHAKRLRYCEGLLDGIPHAWVTINGKVVDVTMEVVQRRLKRNGLPPSAPRGYQGTAIRRDIVHRNIMLTNEFGPVKKFTDSTRGK